LSEPMKTFILILSGLILAGAMLTSCAKKEESATDLVSFPLKGEVISIDTIKLRVTIAHEEIPDYMAAMTMPFKVKDAELLNGIEPGDSVNGTLAVSRTGSWLAVLNEFGNGAPPSTLRAGEIEMQRMLKPGDILPDVPLVDQEGRPFRFSDLRDKALAVTFVYTRCPLPEFCILMSNNFARIQKTLSADHTIDGQWHLVTISFDPRFDPPRVMKGYGRSYGADFSRWSFVTDADTAGRNILKIADGLGLVYEDDEGATISHNLRTVLVGKDGKIVEIIKDNEWKAEDVGGKMMGIAKAE